MTEEARVENSHNDQWILDRISHLPVMVTALDQLNSIYSKAKENKLVEVTANATGAGLEMAFNIAKPVAEKFEKQVDFLNKTACQQLDKLEENFPIITKPTEQVVKATLDLGHKIVDPVVTKVSSVRDYGADKVAGVKEQANKTLAYGGHVLSDATNFTVGMTVGTAAYGCQKAKEVLAATGSYGVAKVSSVKDFGVEKASEVKQKVVGMVSTGADSLESAKKLVVGKVSETSTQLGTAMKSSFDDKLVAYETYLDYYLPPEEGEKESKSDEKTSTVHKVYLISDKTRNRMKNKIKREITSTCQQLGSVKEASIARLENTKSYVFSVPEKVSSGISFVKSSSADAVSAASYEALSVVSALVAAANGAKDKVEGMYKGVNLSQDFEKLLASGKEFGLKFVHDVKDGSENIVSYAIHLPREKYQLAKDKVVFLWMEITKHEEEVLKEVLEDESANHSPEASTLERKLIITSRHLLQKTKDMSAPVFGLVQVTKKNLYEAVDHIKNGLPELSSEKVLDTSIMQVSIMKPDFSKLVSDTYAASAEFLKKINGALWDAVFNGISTKNLCVATARAVGVHGSVQVEVERPLRSIIGNHEEIRNIDDVTAEEEEEEEEEEKEEEEEEEEVEVKYENNEDDVDGDDDDDDIVETPTR